MTRKGGGSEFTGFELKINTLSGTSVSGRFSVLMEEVNWNLNAETFDDLEENDTNNPFCFEDALVDNLDSLTIRFSVWFVEVDADEESSNNESTSSEE